MREVKFRALMIDPPKSYFDKDGKFIEMGAWE